MSTMKNKSPKAALRDATLEDAKLMKAQVKFSTRKFFGDRDLEELHRSSCYTLIGEYEKKELASFVNVENSPNVSAIPKCWWLPWIRNMYKMVQATYENTLFITFLYLDDPHNSNLLFQIFQEIFLREPKLKFICTVGPPVDSFYDDILAEFCRQINSTESSVSRLSQSIFVCERVTILPKMRLRRAIAEDNDDLVEMIDEKMKEIRKKLGDFYIAEEVMRKNPNDTIIVAEISHVTVGMIWINSDIDRQMLARNFETTAFGNFLQPSRRADENAIELVHDIMRRRSNYFFDFGRRKSSQTSAIYDKTSEIPRQSLNNLYGDSSESESSYEDDGSEQEVLSLKSVFKIWGMINKRFRSPDNFVQQIERIVKVPKSASVANAFAIRLYGLSRDIHSRRIFELIAGAFAAYPDKDYCLISLASREASSDSLNGPLLRYFSRMVPRTGSRMSDLVYVTHRNSFIGETAVDFATEEDVAAIESMVCFTNFKGQQHYLPEIMNTLDDAISNPWSEFHAMVIRSSGCPIGFVMLKQDTDFDEFQQNYVLFEEDEEYSWREMGELKYFQIHPAFVWQYKFLVREVFRLTGYCAMHFRLSREYGKPVLNTIITTMYPIFARKRAFASKPLLYALYYFNIKSLHADRICIEDKIVIIGFTEACKGFLRNLLYSDRSRYIRFLNVYVVTPSPGYLEAEYEMKSFNKGHMMFFKSKNQYDEIYLRMIEFRTFFSFLAGQFRGINTKTKRLYIDNVQAVSYDRLFLMCSTRYSPPKPIRNIPTNFVTTNSRLDKIIFYQKIRVLLSDFPDLNYPPILVFGCEVVSHECVATMIQLGVPPAKITLVLQRTGGTINFPEQFDDECVVKMVLKRERDAGVRVYENVKFLDWNLHTDEYAIQNCIFEANFERIILPCSMFVSFFPQSLAEVMKEPKVNIHDNHILVDEFSQTNIPDVYACGRVAKYRDHLFAKPRDQLHANQIEVGNLIASNFLNNRLGGEKCTMLEQEYVKPLFRQAELIDSMIYGGLRRPGQYIPRNIRKNLRIYGQDLVTQDNNVEYCRLYLDKNGVISEVACTTRKYKNLEVVYRIYGFHESLFDNLKLRCDRGEVTNILDYILEGPFALVVHDQFLNVKNKFRARHVECLKEVFKNVKKSPDRDGIIQKLNDHKMLDLLQEDISKFILKYPLERARYALPRDFDQLRPSSESMNSGDICE